MPTRKTKSDQGITGQKEEEKEIMIVLSLFDGISCGQVALERAGLKVDKYFASEIKKHAIKVTMEHYPGTIQIGDVRKVSYKDGWLHTENGDYEVGKIDLLTGGSPCQDFSCGRTFLRKDKPYGLDGERSGLFYEWLRIKEEVKPIYWLLENVKMKNKAKQELDEYIGVSGVEINSSLVSFQNRIRYYWTNICELTPPNDKNVDFQDYIDKDFEYCLQFKCPQNKTCIRAWNNGRGPEGESMRHCVNITHAHKIGALRTKQYRIPNSGLIEFDGFCRWLTRREIELAQTLPVGYTDCLSYNQMQDVCGDGWTVDVIAHIFSFIPKEGYNEAD